MASHVYLKPEEDITGFKNHLDFSRAPGCRPKHEGSKRSPDLHGEYKQLAQEAMNDSAEGRDTQHSINSQYPQHGGGLVVLQEGAGGPEEAVETSPHRPRPHDQPKSLGKRTGPRLFICSTGHERTYLLCC